MLIRLLILSCCSPLWLLSQTINNGSFENWNSGTPSSWGTFSNWHPNFNKTAAIDSTAVFDGKFSLRLTTDTLQLPWDSQERLYPGFANYGGVVYNAQQAQLSVFGTPYTFRPDTISMALKYMPTGSDSAFISFSFWKKGIQIGGVSTNANEGFKLGTLPNWSYFHFPVFYWSDSVPDTLKIQLLSSDKFPQRGSTLWVDSVNAHISLVNGISEEIENWKPIFPNPVNGELVFSETNSEPQQVEIYASNGTCILQQTTASSIPTSSWKQGVYIVLLKTADGTITFSGKLVKQ
ncbi:MAG: T9SS type A sorting domain-containing protein [Chitinophagales bacterium]